MSFYTKHLSLLVVFVATMYMIASCSPDDPSLIVNGHYMKVFVTFEQPELEPGVDLDHSISFSLKELYEKEKAEGIGGEEGLFYEITVFQKGQKVRYLYNGEESEEGSVFYYAESFDYPIEDDLNYAIFSGGQIVKGRIHTSFNNKAAVSEDNHFYLRNLSGYIYLRLHHEKGDKIGCLSLSLGGADREKLFIRVICDMKLNDAPSIEPVPLIIDDGDIPPDLDTALFWEHIDFWKHIDWYASNSEVVYESDSHTDILLYCPPVVFNNGFSILVSDNRGDLYESDFSQGITQDKIEVHRNKIAFAEMELKPVPRLYYSTSDGNVAYSNSMRGIGSWGGHSVFTSLDNYTGSYGKFVTVLKFGYENGKGFYGFNGIPTKIAAGAFTNCTNLTAIDIPEYITDGIGEDAFFGCSGLTHISLPSRLTHIGRSSFVNCSGLKDLEWAQNADTIELSAFNGCTGLTNITIPPKVTVIEPDTFQGCTGLTRVHFPEQIKKIGNWAFDGCSKLSELNIPASVDTIGVEAFNGCIGPNSITFPAGLKYLGNGAFCDCSGISRIDMSQSQIDTIYESTFEGCTGLVSVELPKGLKHIAQKAFKDCRSLECLVIPEGTKSIGDYILVDCRNLKSITLPASIEFVGEVITNNTSLASLTILAEEPPKGNGNTMFALTPRCIIYVPAKSLEKYKTSEYWSIYADQIKGI